MHKVVLKNRSWFLLGSHNGQSNRIWKVDLQKRPKRQLKVAIFRTFSSCWLLIFESPTLDNNVGLNKYLASPKENYLICNWSKQCVRELMLLILGMEVRHEKQSSFTPSTQLKLGQQKAAIHFKPHMHATYKLLAPAPTRCIAIGGYPKVVSYDMLGEQLYYSNPVKHGQKCDSVIGACVTSCYTVTCTF